MFLAQESAALRREQVPGRKKDGRPGRADPSVPTQAVTEPQRLVRLGSKAVWSETLWTPALMTQSYYLLATLPWSGFSLSTPILGACGSQDYVQCRSTARPMRAIVIPPHCAVGGRSVGEGRRNWAGAVREGLMEEVGLKWTSEEGKDWERQKGVPPKGSWGGIASCGGGATGTWANLYKEFLIEEPYGKWV